jgi:hypothetical protein
MPWVARQYTAPTLASNSTAEEYGVTAATAQRQTARCLSDVTNHPFQHSDRVVVTREHQCAGIGFERGANTSCVLDGCSADRCLPTTELLYVHRHGWTELSCTQQDMVLRVSHGSAQVACAG